MTAARSGHGHFGGYRPGRPVTFCPARPSPGESMLMVGDE